MTIHWTADSILALAPDAQVAKAARGLARRGKWRNLGRAGQTRWGEYQGSAKNPYRAVVDLDGPAFKCTCPSRKRPCKHAIGLFLLVQAEPQVASPAERPEWVQKWLAGRTARAAKKTPKQRKKKVADPAAQARRAARRAKRVQQGVEALSLWLEDLVRRGLGDIQAEPSAFWETQAARLVDAQAPGLARQVRELAGIPASGDGWHQRLLDRLARLYLLLEAYQRLDDLPAGLQEEVRSQVGWTQDQKGLSRQPGRRDRWLVVSRQEVEEDRFRVQRTWLWGIESRRAALILHFARPGRSFETSLVPGTVLDAELVFWSSSYPRRALIKTRHATGTMEALPGYPHLEAALSAYGQALARNPWLESLLLPVSGVTPFRRGDSWAIRDGQDRFLPLDLAPVEGWRLLALSGGHPLDLAAEWDGRRLKPLAAWTGDALVSLGGGW